MDSSISDVSIKVMHSFYSSEREVYSRMVFKLNIDPIMGMKIIAFWLWLQDTANTEIIRRVKTFTDPGLMAVSLLGENYIKGAGESIMKGTSNGFNERAIAGVNHYLNKVCYKVFDDIKDKAELEKAKKRLEALTLEDLLPDMHESSAQNTYLSNNGFERTTYAQTQNDLLREIAKQSVTRSYSSNGLIGRTANTQFHYDTESSARRSYLSDMQSTEDVINNLPDDLLTDFPEPSSAQAYTSDREGGVNTAQDYIKQMTELYTTQAYLSLGGNNNHGGLEKPNIQPRNELSPTAKAYFPTSRVTSSLSRSFSAPSYYTKNLPTNQIASSSASLLPYLPQQSSLSFTSPNTPINTATLPFTTPQNTLQIGGKTVILNTLPNPLVVGPPSQQDIHPDERTLFVTFSNGWPLTLEEIYYFFTLEYGNDVERIYIEEPAERREPQYAHVTFRHIETIFEVLGEEAKKKFLTNGKHLWARRFIPKKKKFNANNITAASTATATSSNYNNNY